jgi:signal transduction histidine kinase
LPIGPAAEILPVADSATTLPDRPISTAASSHFDTTVAGQRNPADRRARELARWLRTGPSPMAIDEGQRMGARGRVGLLTISLALVVGCWSDRRDRGADLGGDVSWLGDAAGTSTLAEVTSAPRREQFRPGTEALPRTRYPRATFWFRLKIDLDEHGLDDGDWMLQLNTRFAHFEVYVADRAEAPAPAWQPQAPVDDSHGAGPVYRLHVQRGSPRWLLCRGQMTDVVIFNPSVMDVPTHLRWHGKLSLFKGLYFGIVLGAMAYNLFLFFWLRDRSYLFYVLFQASFAFSMGAMDGTLMRAGDAFVIEHMLSVRLTELIAASAILFVREFLQLRASKLLWRMSNLFLALTILRALFPAVGSLAALNGLYSITGLLTLPLLVTMVVWAWRAGNPDAPFVLLAFGVLLAIGLSQVLIKVGVFTSAPFSTFRWIRIASATEAILLSTALARRMGRLRRAQTRTLAELAEARLEAAQNLQHKVTALNTLVAGVAHEIGNPLNFAAGGAEDVAERLATAEAHLAGARPPDAGAALGEALRAARASLAMVSRGTERIRRILDNLRALVGTGAEQLEDTDLNASVRSTLALLVDRVRDQRIEVALRLGHVPPVRCRAGELNQVAMNLMLNACQAMPEGGRLEIVTESDGQRTRMTVADNGPGVRPEDRRSVFDPFFTTRSPKEGTGLGLAVSLEIVRRLGGTLELLPSPPGARGATFAVSLPNS